MMSPVCVSVRRALARGTGGCTATDIKAREVRIGSRVAISEREAAAEDPPGWYLRMIHAHGAAVSFE